MSLDVAIRWQRSSCRYRRRGTNIPVVPAAGRPSHNAADYTRRATTVPSMARPTVIARHST